MTAFESGALVLSVYGYADRVNDWFRKKKAKLSGKKGPTGDTQARVGRTDGESVCRKNCAVTKPKNIVKAKVVPNAKHNEVLRLMGDPSEQGADRHTAYHKKAVEARKVCGFRIGGLSKRKVRQKSVAYGTAVYKRVVKFKRGGRRSLRRIPVQTTERARTKC